MEAKNSFHFGSVVKQSNIFHAQGEKVQKSMSSNGSSSPSISNGSSSPELETQSSDMEVCQMFANSSSSSSGFSDMQCSTDSPDEENSSILQINGSITLSLKEAKLWYKFLEIGTEMAINRTGRYSFQYHTFYLNSLKKRSI